MLYSLSHLHQTRCYYRNMRVNEQERDDYGVNGGENDRLGKAEA